MSFEWWYLLMIPDDSTSSCWYLLYACVPGCTNVWILLSVIGLILVIRLHWDPNAHLGPLSIYLLGKSIRLPLLLCAVAQVFYTPCTWKCWLTNKFHGAGIISGSLVWTRCHRPAESSFAQAIFVRSSFLAHFSCPNKKLSYSQRSPHWRPRFSVLGGIALWDI